jgi:hypothetical protein
MNQLRIHLYALCLNEERMLPFFFQHYENIVDRFFIFDNGSNDNSLEILRNHPKVDLKSISFHGTSFVLSALIFYNTCWKESRNKADWVIVCNIDEHIHHENLRTYLDECSEKGYTLIKPEGFEMVSKEFPKADQPLRQQIRRGVREIAFDKPQLFQPNSIKEINFLPGRHNAKPEGNIQLPPNSEVKLLHYKHLGYEYFIQRLSELREGLKENDRTRNFGRQYDWDEKQKIQHLQRLLEISVDVV